LYPSSQNAIYLNSASLFFFSFSFLFWFFFQLIFFHFIIYYYIFFYWVIILLWHKSWVWRVNQVDSFFFFFLINFYLLDWLRIRLHDLFCLLSIMLFQPHNLEIVLNGLTWADSSCLLCNFFHCIFFSISSFNIRSVRNWAS
jgi:hypothetical protein